MVVFRARTGPEVVNMANRMVGKTPSGQNRWHKRWNERVVMAVVVVGEIVGKYVIKSR